MIFKNFRSLARAATGLAALGAALAVNPAAGQGDLLVAPTRIVLEGSRGAEVVLSNIGSEEATYRIGLELRRMLPNGELVPVEEETANEKEQAALAMIRYAPRRITLPPGQPQSVRIGARPGAELPDGEYRVHMAFRAIPKARARTEAPDPDGGVQIRLIPVYGVTIPIIVRHGRLETSAAISNPRVVQTDEGSALTLGLARGGEKSIFGELRVSRQGSGDPVFIARGIAVYTDIDERSVSFPLTPEQAAAMNGPLRFEYREMPEAGGRVITSVDTVL